MKVRSLLSGTAIPLPVRKREEPKPVNVEEVVRWAMRRVEEEQALRQAAETRAQQAMEQHHTEMASMRERLGATEAERDGHSAARDEEARRAEQHAAMVAKMTAEREESERRSKESDAEFRAVLEQLSAVRSELSAANDSVRLSKGETASARLEAEQLRARLLVAPEPLQFSVDVMRDRVGLIRGIVVNAGKETILVDVIRNSVGKIKQLVRKGK